jgi:hypothetical protein
MKNLAQIIPNTQERQEVVICLKYARHIIKLMSQSKHLEVDPNELAFVGFMIVKFAYVQQEETENIPTYNDLARQANTYRNKAIEHLKAKNKAEKIPKIYNLEQADKFDLNFADHLIYSWYSKNEKIDPSDALYISGVVHSKYRDLTNKPAIALMNPEMMYKLATNFNVAAINFNKKRYS